MTSVLEATLGSILALAPVAAFVAVVALTLLKGDANGERVD